MTAAWLLLLYAAANIWLLRVMINKIEPLWELPLIFLVAGIPLSAGGMIYFFFRISITPDGFLGDPPPFKRMRHGSIPARATITHM